LRELLLRRRADVDVDLLVAAKPPATKHKQRADDKNHEDYENRYYPCTCCTAAIVCHFLFPPVNLTVK